VHVTAGAQQEEEIRGIEINRDTRDRDKRDRDKRDRDKRDRDKRGRDKRGRDKRGRDRIPILSTYGSSECILRPVI
jgi:hypothetical protein